MTALNIVALGDSLTQGLVSGATTSPRWSYPAIIARALGLAVPADYRVLEDEGPGMPLDVEGLLYELERSLGDSISALEWVTKLPAAVNQWVRDTEEFYERGAGRWPRAEHVHLHNLAVLGLTLHEALTLTSSNCQVAIDEAEGRVLDDFFGLPAAPTYRTAQLVLNAANEAARAEHTMLDALRELGQREPIDILLIWLGANDCLATVLEMRLEEMPANFPDASPFARQRFTLTSAEQFHRDFERLVAGVEDALAGSSGRRQVYVGTVPHVTIPPVTTGLGAFRDGYFEAYGRFYRDSHRRGDTVLERSEIERIDRRIDAFNHSIETLASAQGWTVVDTVGILDTLAVKRNRLTHDPGQALRTYLAGQGYASHPLLELDPVPSILPYVVGERADGRGFGRLGGGIFSLDYVHPTVVGYGLIAEHYLDRIKANNPGDPTIAGAQIDWSGILAADRLFSSPPVLWDDLGAKLGDHAWLLDPLLRVFT